ncbi:MAG: putative Zn-dependent protease [Phenylobacterium sp.]|jgi:predicted Zn-dependent protease
MAILTEQHAKELLKKVLSYSKADECEVQLDGTEAGNIRYARNTVTTSGEASDVVLAVQSSFGKQTGVATANEFDDASLKKVVRRSEELAKLAPENPEHMPINGPQKYLKATNYVKSTANVQPVDRAKAADASITPSKKNKLICSGYLEDTVQCLAMMNSKGLFAYNLSTETNFSVTIRTEDGKGSGWGARDYADSSKLDTAAISAIAIEKSIASATAKAMEPGKYTVILEPAASVGLLTNMANAMGQRSADEGRSFLSLKAKEGDKKSPINKLGQKMFDERVSIYSDPQHPDVPRIPFANDGYPVKRIDWVKNGVITNMPNSAYWAKKTNTAYNATSFNPSQFGPDTQIIMEGGDESLADMIKNTRRGILVTRLWYIRLLDPQSQMYTGLTRDGTFYIEDGKIKYPVKNFRFNESPIVMLNNIEALGKPMRTNGCMIPPMKIRDFTFSSLSDAV